VLPIDGLDRVASPAALEAALLRAGADSVSMNVAAGRVRITLDPARVSLRDVTAAVCAAGCGVYVLETLVRVRSLDYPWRGAAVVETLRRQVGVVDAEWDRQTDCFVVSYLPSRTRSSDLIDAIVAAGYRLAANPLMVSEVPAVYTLSKGPGATPRRHRETLSVR